MERRRVLIVGLGNPGPRYETTRHNVGHVVVRGMAQDLGWEVKKSGVEGRVAIGLHKEVEVHFFLPTTYMNHSGIAVQQAVEGFSIAVEDLLVVTDDVYVPFGSFRLREKGSAGGHNGLKSIAAHLGTQEFARLRVGIGEPFTSTLEEYVLADFTRHELEKMPEIIKHGKVVIDFWIQRDMGAAHDFIAKMAPLKNVGE